jgi:hypothetical protein
MLREQPLVLLIHDALSDKNGTSASIHKPQIDWRSAVKSSIVEVFWLLQGERGTTGH